MIVPSALRRKFVDGEQNLLALEGRVQTPVFRFCNDNGYAYVGRRKTVESVAEKIESGRYQTWTSLDDLFGCSIVVPTLADEQLVLEFLARAFEQVDLKKRGSTKKPPDAFRFEATRFIGRTAADLPLFEVQIRTAFEHAWSVTTHALVYKTGDIDWKAQRLAAQMKAAVEQLDALVLAFKESSGPLVEHDWYSIAARKAILDRFRALRSRGFVPEEGVPNNWSRFADNVYALIQAGGKTRVESRLEDAIAVCEQEAQRLGDKFPRSISLFQFVLGTLTTSGNLRFPLIEFAPLITDELRTVYPKTQSIAGGFDLDK